MNGVRIEPEAWRDAWDRRHAETDSLWRAEPSQWLAAELDALPPGRALDLACGAGRIAVRLAERGWRVTGIDISQVAIARARALAAARGVAVEWVVADVLTHPLPDAAYDLVLVAYLHLPPPERAALLRRVAAALAPGGTALVVGHDLRNLGSGARGPREPAVLYTPEAVVAGLAGLRVEAAHRVERPVDVDGAPRTAVDTVVRATRPAA